MIGLKVFKSQTRCQILHPSDTHLRLIWVFFDRIVLEVQLLNRNYLMLYYGFSELHLFHSTLGCQTSCWTHSNSFKQVESP